MTSEEYAAAVLDLIASVVEPSPLVDDFGGFVASRILGPGREYELDPTTQGFEELSAPEVLVNLAEEVADVIAYAEQLRHLAPALSENARRMASLAVMMAHVLAACSVVLEDGH